MDLESLLVKNILLKTRHTDTKANQPQVSRALYLGSIHTHSGLTQPRNIFWCSIDSWSDIVKYTYFTKESPRT